jgi:hypothetical protein
VVLLVSARGKLNHRAWFLADDMMKINSLSKNPLPNSRRLIPHVFQ